MRLPIGFVLCFASLAVAAPLHTKSGESVRVRLAGRSERGIGLRPVAGAWRLQLDGAPSKVTDATAEVTDVTNGAPSDKWLVAVESGALTFDGARFVAGHAYRVALRGAGDALVYLYAPPRGRSASVVFADQEAPAPANDDGIAITPKSAL